MILLCVIFIPLTVLVSVVMWKADKVSCLRPWLQPTSRPAIKRKPENNDIKSGDAGVMVVIAILALSGSLGFSLGA